MPFKHNESRSHKFIKPKYKVTNWPEPNDSLRQRGDITIWFTEAAINEWRPTKTGARGRPQEYSDHAIETALLILQVFHLPLRQTEGFMHSMTRLMNAAISIPDFSSISRRSIELPRHVLSKARQSGSLVIVDSTGLKVYGKDEWHQEKHAVLARRTWRKLHLAVDENHEILACELTTPEVGDPTAVPDLLDQIDTPFETFMGDGAFDGESTSQAVLSKQPHAQIVVPPHKTAVVSSAGDTQRDEHIRVIAAHGRIAWQKKNGYGLRAHVELAIQRYKRIIGSITPCVRLVVASKNSHLEAQTTMKPKYTEAFIEQAVVKLLGRGNRTVKDVALELNVSHGVARNWIARRKPGATAALPTKEKRPQDWSSEEQLVALHESHTLTGEALHGWCRERGLFAHHLTGWKNAFCMAAKAIPGTQELRTLKDENQQLKRDLARKEKALSQAAALLILQKKFRALWEDEAK